MATFIDSFALTCPDNQEISYKFVPSICDEGCPNLDLGCDSDNDPAPKDGVCVCRPGCARLRDNSCVPMTTCPICGENEVVSYQECKPTICDEACPNAGFGCATVCTDAPKEGVCRCAIGHVRCPFSKKCVSDKICATLGGKL